MSQVTEVEKKLILQIVRRLLPEAKVIAFGSRVKGTARQYSDLDLAVQMKEKIPFSVMSAISELFSESDLPYKIDFIDMNLVEDSFRQHILATGEPWT